MDFQPARDLIRCHPFFHKSIRFDPVLVQTADSGLSVARLHMVFELRAFGRTWAIARVSHFRRRIRSSASRIDQARVQEESKGSFILVSSIVRAVHLIPHWSMDGPMDGEFFVNDLIDPDMFLRLQGHM